MPLTHVRSHCVAAALAALVALACGDAQPTGPADGPVIASAQAGKTATPSVRATSPTGGSPGQTLDVRVLGGGYDAGSRADFALKGTVGPDIVTNRTTYVSSRELIANITISSTATLALYDVVVTAATGRKGIGTELFEVAYIQTPLGSFGGSRGEAVAVNDRDQIAGWSDDRNGMSWPFLWENGQMRKLSPTLKGYARDMNASGAIVGQSDLKPWMWTAAGGVQWLPVLPGHATGAAEAISDNGLIVGTSSNGTTSRGVMWDQGRIVATFDFVPHDVNDDGVVVGSGWSGRQGSVRWTASGGTTFLGGSADGAEALGINRGGDIVGWFASSGGNEAYLWRGGSRIPLGAMSGGASVALGISPPGDVIAGRSGTRPIVWIDGASQLLGSFRSPIANGSAFAVNTNGWVVGSDGGAVVWRMQPRR